MKCKQNSECKEVRFDFITIPNIFMYLYHSDIMILFLSIIVKNSIFAESKLLANSGWFDGKLH